MRGTIFVLAALVLSTVPSGEAPGNDHKAPKVRFLEMEDDTLYLLGSPQDTSGVTDGADPTYAGSTEVAGCGNAPCAVHRFKVETIDRQSGVAVVEVFANGNRVVRRTILVPDVSEVVTPFSIGTLAGVYELEAVATDHAGNVARATRTIVIVA
ncbi:MAG: hypothetical protein ACT4PT_10805 [Methanobacteriota archaeon]